jgi:magnesium-transporting ATPase (P-type)
MQMLWINIIMDTLAALAFAGEAPLKSFMKEAPIPKSEPVLNGDMLTKIFVMGVYTVMLCLFYHNSSFIRGIFRSSENDIYFLSGFFALFVFCGIFGAFNARASRLNLFSGLLTNPMFISVISLVFTVQMALIYYGGEIFRCAPLTFSELKTVVILAFTVIPVGRILEFIMKNTGKTLTVKGGEPSVITNNLYVVKSK